MIRMNRRDLVTALAALAAAPALAESQPVPNPADPVLGSPRVFVYDDLPVKHNPNGSDARPIAQGTLPTGEYLSMHESVIPVGATPNPLHQHRPTDIMYVREGTIAFEHDGKSEHVGPGGIVFAASMTAHTIRNVGSVPAKYFVIGISHEAPKQLA